MTAILPDPLPVSLPVSPRSRPDDAERSGRTRDLLARAHAPGADAHEAAACLEEVVELNMRVAEALARRYARRGIALEDLTQVAYLALVRAVRSFDPQHERDLLAYAVPCITGELRRHFRDHGWSIRPPREVQRAHGRLLRTDAALDRLDEPGIAALAAEVEESVEVVREALLARSCFALTSLDTPAGTGGSGGAGGEAGDPVLRSVPDPDHEQRTAALEARLVIEPLLATLAPREAELVRLRFTEELSQREIAERLDLSQVQVSRLLQKVLLQLRHALGPLGGYDLAC